jgi:hypothetical protein
MTSETFYFGMHFLVAQHRWAQDDCSGPLDHGLDIFGARCVQTLRVQLGDAGFSCITKQTELAIYSFDEANESVKTYLASARFQTNQL